MLGREAYQDGQLQRPIGARVFERAGIVLTRRALPLRVAAACSVALAVSAQAYGWQGRRFRDLACA